DVVFLADTTGSMASTLANVQANATPIMNQVIATPGVGTPAFAAAQYKDFNIPDDCIPSSAFPFQIDQGITTTTGDVQTAINTWSASGGCDTPEAQINALWELAQPGAGVFRADGTSTRIIVWFGDATGHDPSGGHTIGDAISALQAAHVKVIAV